jgi:hypothetical protein
LYAHDADPEKGQKTYDRALQGMKAKKFEQSSTYGAQGGKNKGAKYVERDGSIVEFMKRMVRAHLETEEIIERVLANDRLWSGTDPLAPKTLREKFLARARREVKAEKKRPV